MTGAALFAQMKQERPFVQLGELVYAYLYEEIINLHLPPGTRLNESKIADELEISRTPVKYALNRLSEELLITRDGKLMMVSPMNKQGTKKLYEARIAIESHAVFLAASRISPRQLDDLADLAKKYQQVVRTGSLETHVEYDHRFHGMIIRAAGNSYISDMYKNIESRLLHYRHCLLSVIAREQLHPILETASRHHLAVVNALRLGFEDVASSELRRDIDGMTDIFFEWK